MMDHHDITNMRTLDMLKCVGVNDVVVDVGACDGTYTNYFKNKLLGTGKIYCLEMSPTNFEVLNQRFAQDNISIINVAVSDHEGDVTFYNGATKEEFNLVGHNTSFKKMEEAGTIACSTLDKILEKEDRIKIIKIDVEGAELQVLRGMKRIAEKTECILLENHFDEDWPEIRKILIEDYGFTCYNIEKQEGVTMESPRPYQCLCQREA